jgi:hypothetical protein
VCIVLSFLFSRAQQYWDLRDEVVAAEQILLRTLDFDLTFVHPHKYLLNYVNSLNGPLHPTLTPPTALKHAPRR